VVQAFGLSDVGLVRSNNEDAYVVLPGLAFFAVADGVGGHAAGEVAARMAIDAVQAVLMDPAGSAPPGLHRLAGGVEYANARVYAAAQERGRVKMGTTFTGLLLEDGRACLAHVGDSRAYLLRGRRLVQLTEDHTLVGAYVQAGIMTREEAAVSEVRNIITRAVGVEETVEVDTRQLAVEPGDTFLLCSDGLHGVVGDEDMTSILLRERDLTRAAAELVQRANDAGGPDNVTAVLARVG
jgi:protein phosphatase